MIRDDADLEFVPDESPGEEEMAKQYAANLTDKYPQLAAKFNGRTWPEILRIVGYKPHRY